jgi:hypothetical protein
VKVGRQHNSDHRLQPASIEGLGLDNQDRSAKSWFGALRFPKVGPPEIAALNYHGFFLRERA